METNSGYLVNKWKPFVVYTKQMPFVLFAALLVIANSQNTPLCLNTTLPVCPYSLGNFFLSCSLLTLPDAIAFCTDRGWQLANVDDYNQSASLQTQSWCVGSNSTAFVNSFNGLSGGPCAVQTGLGEAVVNGQCSGVRRYAVCQAPQQVTKETTITTTRTVITGPVRVTVTVTPCHRSDSLLKAALYRPCSPVCQDDSIPSLRVVKEAVPFEQADAVCRKHGWRLADYTAGMQEQVAGLSVKCANGTSVWIRSFNGVDGAMCIYADSANLVHFGYNNHACSQHQLYPLCNIECKPAPTAHGPITGTLTTFTSATRTTATVRTAANTITDYVTSWPTHNPRDRHCCCRECFNKHL